MRGLLAPSIKLVIFLVVTVSATYLLAVTIANSSSLHRRHESQRRR